MATTDSPKQPAISADIFGSKLTLTFSHGESLELDSATLSADIRQAALMHGLKQKLIDAAAISRNMDTGRSATIADKFAAVKEVYDRISKPDGEWNKSRTGDNTTSQRGGLLVAAIMEITGKDRETAIAWLASKSEEEKKALRGNARIAPVIARMQADRDKAKQAKSGIDTDDMLDGLMG